MQVEVEIREIVTKKETVDIPVPLYLHNEISMDEHGYSHELYRVDNAKGGGVKAKWKDYFHGGIQEFEVNFFEIDKEFAALVHYAQNKETGIDIIAKEEYENLLVEVKERFGI